jgi:PrtD family type I secretion system ABC transporter
MFGWRNLSFTPRTEIERAFSACHGSFFRIFLLSAALNLFGLTLPLYLLQVYDHVIPSRSMDTLLMLSLIVVLALGVHAILESIRKEILTRIGEWLDDRIQPWLIDGALAAAGRNDASGASQAWRDAAAIRSFFSGGSIASLFDAPWTPIFLVALVLIHPLLGGIAVVGCLLMFMCALLNERLTNRPLALAAVASARSQHRLDGLLRNAEAITAMGMLPGVARLLRDDHKEATEAMSQANLRSSKVQSASRFLRLLTQVLVMAAATWLVVHRDLSPAAIFASSILLGRGLGPVENAIGTWKAFAAARIAFRRLQKLMASVPMQPALMKLPEPDGFVAIERLTYLPSGAEQPVLKRVSFTLTPGQVLGVVGPSGAGKTTLGRLIAGTLQPTAGHVRVDGADVSVWQASGGHGYFGYLPQDVELLSGSVRDNIARLQETDSKKVIDAATLVGLHETIMRLPEGYDTDIGEAGKRLSGGQKQRLGLARAFFGEPKVVVLDEPNASLDIEGETALQNAISTMRDRGTTVIIIAQRLGVLAVADKILVLSQGAIDTIGERNQVAGLIKAGKTALPVKPPSLPQATTHQARNPSDQERIRAAVDTIRQAIRIEPDAVTNSNDGLANAPDADGRENAHEKRAQA